MNSLVRLALLAAPLAVLLPACAVETSSTSTPSEEGTPAASPAAATEKADFIIHPIPRCEPLALATSGSLVCTGTTLTGEVTATSDISYASSCAERASFSTTAPDCGAAGYGVQQILGVRIASSLDGSTLAPAYCATSYLDYTVEIESRATQTWSTQSGRVYGTYANGHCSLSYEPGYYNNSGTESIMAVEATADSYEVLIGESFNESFVQGVDFEAIALTEQ